MPIPFLIAGLVKLITDKSVAHAGVKHAVAKGAHRKAAGKLRKKKDGPELEVEVEAGDEGGEDENK
jgi:hypothetical protein